VSLVVSLVVRPAVNVPSGEAMMKYSRHITSGKSHS